jgi:hypothetical protein
MADLKDYFTNVVFLLFSVVPCYGQPGYFIWYIGSDYSIYISLNLLRWQNMYFIKIEHVLFMTECSNVKSNFFFGTL